MDLPGAGVGLDTPELRDKAEKRAESLLETLKKSVKVDLQDIGVLRKSMQVTVPADIISQQIESQFEDLASDAHVPGFRKGRAPRALLQKRFGAHVRDSLKTGLVGQSYFAAIEEHKLQVLGDPLFRIETSNGIKLMELGEALQSIEVPMSGDFTYTCELEVKPEFELPELKGIQIKAPEIAITEKMVDEWIERQRKIRGRYEPHPEGAAGADDQLIADVTLSAEGKEVKREANLQLGVRPTRLDGITLMDLGEKLKGAKVGSKIVAECTIPDDYERADLRGKPATFTFEIHELKRLQPASVEDLVNEVGAKDEAQLREFVKDDLEADRDIYMARAKREQVNDYLLKTIKLDLPENLSARQTDRAVMRAVVELHQRGTPPSEIEARIDELRTVAREQVARELRLQFILEKVAEQRGIRVFDEEVNTEIARIARRYGRRFDRVRDDLQREGLLLQLADQIRQDKAIAQLIEEAQVDTSVPAEAPAEPKTAAGGEASAADASASGEAKPKKTRKKATKKDADEAAGT
jgi:trigger factor